jgi:C1A family cysteine protease
MEKGKGTSEGMRHLGLQISEKEKAINLAAANKFRTQFRLKTQPPKAFSWLNQKKVTPVKDQGDCGSGGSISVDWLPCV